MPFGSDEAASGAVSTRISLATRLKQKLLLCVFLLAQFVYLLWVSLISKENGLNPLIFLDVSWLNMYEEYVHFLYINLFIWPAKFFFSSAFNECIRSLPSNTAASDT